jgi:hypothetical protein
VHIYPFNTGDYGDTCIFTHLIPASSLFFLGLTGMVLSQAKPLFPPRRRRHRHRYCQIKLHPEKTRGWAGWAAQFVGEAGGVCLQRPDVGDGAVQLVLPEGGDAVGVDREALAGRGASVDGVAAIVGDRVVRAIFMAVIMLQAQARGGAGDHPGAAAVVADVKGDLDPVRRTAAQVHHQRFAGHVRIGRGIGDQPPGKGLSAQCVQPGHELGLRVRVSGAGGAPRQQQGGQSDCGGGFHHAARI